MTDAQTPEVDLDNVIDRLLEGEYGQGHGQCGKGGD